MSPKKDKERNNVDDGLVQLQVKEIILKPNTASGFNHPIQRPNIA